MALSGIDLVLDYLSYLVAERGPDEPFLLSQLQPAIQFKFPGFNFADYGLANVRDFLQLGEKADYFRLVNTGDLKTMHLRPGGKKRTGTLPAILEEIPAEGVRRTHYMQTLLENLLNAERADQVINAVRGTDSLSKEFDSFLGAQEKATGLYYVRGKIARLRAFLAVVRESGEATAIPTWKVSRAVLNTPAVPTIREAARLGATIFAVMSDKVRVGDVPPDMLDDMFMGVLRYCRARLAQSRAWDWVAGIDILEAELRAIAQHVATVRAQQKKTGLLRATPIGKQQTARLGNITGPLVNPFDEAKIEQTAKMLLREAGVRMTLDETAIWQAYVAAEGVEAGQKFLAERPSLLKSDPFVEWLEDGLASAVAARDERAIQLYANKSALVVAARQVGGLGMVGLRKQPEAVKAVYESIMEGVGLMRLVFDYLNPTTDALSFLKAKPDFARDESVGDLMDEQMVKAADTGDTARYRFVSERADLWRKVAELGAEHGPAQHARFLAQHRSEQDLMAEMGLLLLQNARDNEARRDVLERYAAVATEKGLALARGMLDQLSFQGAPQALFQHHVEVARLIERCVKIGIDRALAEMR
jgi:hypothetical protein